MRVLLLLMLFSLEVAAETVRVAVVRGASIELTGASLEVRLAQDESWRPLGASVKAWATKEGVSVGELSTQVLHVRDASGAVVRGEGRALLGHGELRVVKGTLVLIDEVELEVYVASVVGAEMPASWPAAALEAQSIAVRTYALSRRQKTPPQALWHLEATVSDQVYNGTRSLELSTVLASSATSGQVLMHAGELADAFFFSSCVGQTESAQAAFGGQGAPYLVPVACQGGEAANNARWQRKVPVQKLAGKLKASGALGDELVKISIASRTKSGRVATVELKTRRGGKRVVKGSELRGYIGWGELPSLDFEVEVKGKDFVFTGRGAGHAVGLCQWCARAQAQAGLGAEAILAHFYPGTELRRLEGQAELEARNEE